jgi:hypothetical protein
MTAELADNLGHVNRKHIRKSVPKNTFPGARYRQVSSESGTGKTRRRTLAMDPQERTSGLPLFEKTTSEEPVGRALVLSAALDNMICGWIRRREPLSKVLSPLAPCCIETF